MSDPFSIAAGAFQVAGAGVQLAQTLYRFASTVRDAEKDVSVVAMEVNLTSSVLESLATVLHENDDVRGICSVTLLGDAGSALGGCKRAFDELDKALRSTMKTDDAGKTRIPFLARAKWPLNKSKMAVLQSNLERLKTTLSPMLDVLNLASKKADKASIQLDSTMQADRERLERLIKSNEELYHSIASGFQGGESQAKKTNHQENGDRDSISQTEGRVLVNTILQPLTSTPASRRAWQDDKDALDEIDTARSVQQNSESGSEGSKTAFHTISVSPESPSPEKREPTKGQGACSARSLSIQEQQPEGGSPEMRKLKECSEAVARLSDSLDVAMTAWRDEKTFKVAAIVRDFVRLEASIDKIEEMNVDDSATRDCFAIYGDNPDIGARAKQHVDEGALAGVGGEHIPRRGEREKPQSEGTKDIIREGRRNPASIIIREEQRSAGPDTIQCSGSFNRRDNYSSSEDSMDQLGLQMMQVYPDEDRRGIGSAQHLDKLEDEGDVWPLALDEDDNLPVPWKADAVRRAESASGHDAIDALLRRWTVTPADA